MKKLGMLVPVMTMKYSASTVGIVSSVTDKGFNFYKGPLISRYASSADRQFSCQKEVHSRPADASTGHSDRTPALMKEVSVLN